MTTNRLTPRRSVLATGILLLAGSASPLIAGPSAQVSKIPLYFEPNLGQAPQGVEFLARGENYMALVTPDGVTLHLRSGTCGGKERKGPMGREAETEGMDAGLPETPCRTEMATLRVEGRSKKSRLIPEERLEGISNYLTGNDPSRWRTHIPHFAAVRVGDVYPGIDMVLRPSGSNLRYDFEVRPGADPGRIQLRLQGPEKTELSDERLIHHFKGGRLEQTNLRVSQGADDIAGASFSLTSDGRIGFDVQAWNRREKLVIDPTLAWSTFLGGYGPEQARAIAVDGSGNAYVTGRVSNPVFPVTAGAYDTTYSGGYDVFVTKLDSAGSGLVYSTLLGGAGDDDPAGIAVDSSGRALITGSTSSPGFPATTGAYDTSQNGGADAFLTRLNAMGTDLIFSTFLGGSDQDYGKGVALDSSENAYVTGYTTSTNYPVSAGAHDTSQNGSNDVFVTKVNSTGTGIVYSTFLGGYTNDLAHGIAVDTLGSAYVTGHTWSPDFPVTAGAYDGNHNGYEDVFVTKLNATGTGLAYSAFLGGMYSDYGAGIAVDALGGVYVTGYTSSPDFPVTGSSYDNSHNGGFDVFVTKLNSAGASLVYSTFLGGPAADTASGIALDALGSAYVTMTTDSVGFPTTIGAYDTSFNGSRDASVAKLNPAGTTLLYSTFLGGPDDDLGNAIAVDATGSAHVTGETRSSSFPVTTGAYGPAMAGDHDSFVTKLSIGGDSLSYSTFLGGAGSFSGSGWSQSLTTDSSGSVYVTGRTYSSSFPTGAGSYDTAHNGGDDAFVTKLNAAGTSLVYSTFLGGSGGDWGNGIASDASGNTYVSGYTLSSNFPTTAGAYDTSHNGGFDVFVTKLNATGTGLIYSTFLGGSGWDRGRGIALDTSGSAYVTGHTDSTGFPTTAGTYDTTFNGGEDAFVTKLNATGTGLVYSTLLGGSNGDAGYAIALDNSGTALVTGSTSSADFPATAGAYDTSHNGNDDAFVAKVNTTGTGLLFSTFLGGSSKDDATAITLDASGIAFVTGYTWSADFPTTGGAFDTSHNGNYDAFVAKVNTTGTGLVFSTFLGGSDSDAGFGIAVDAMGTAFVTGYTRSTDFPATADAFDTSHNGNSDAFVAKVNTTGTGLLFSTFLGGSDNDLGYAIALDALGSAYVTGLTDSSDFPASPGAFQDSTPSGDGSVFVAKLTFNQAPTITPFAMVTVPRGATTNVLVATVTDPDTVPPGLFVTATGAPAGITVANFVLTPTTPGHYNVTADIIAACNAAAMGPVNLQVTDGIAAPAAGSFTLNTTDAAAGATLTGGATLCAGETTTLSVALTGTGPWSLTWSDGFVQSGITTSPATRVVTPAVTTTYTITAVSGANGCAGTATGSALVTVNPRPTAAVTGGGTICAGTVSTVAVALTGTAPWTITWSDGMVQIAAASPAARLVSPTFNQSFSVLSLSDANCTGGTATGAAAFVVEPVPSAAITAPSGVCESSAGNTASVPDGGPGVTYAWTISGGTLTSPSNASSVTFAAGSAGIGGLGAPHGPASSRYQEIASGSVILTVTVTRAGCPSVGTKTIPIQMPPAVPTPSIPADGSTYSGSFVSWTHAGGSSYDVYLDTVNPPEKLIFSGQTNNLEAFIPSWVSGVTYSWKVVARNACGSSASPLRSFTAGNCPWTGTAPVLTSPVNGAAGVAATAALTWTPVPGAAHYDVYVGTNPENLTRYDVAQAPETSVFVPVSPGVTYHWKVVAVPICGSATSSSSSTSTFTASGSAFGATAFAPSIFNRWETGTVTLSGSGFTAGMHLFTDLHGANAGTVVPAIFTNALSNPSQLQATLIGNPAAPVGLYDVGVTLSGIEEGRLLQAMALRAFTDVTENDFYYLSSARMADAGIMESDFASGTPGPQFSPATKVSRALMAEYLVKSHLYWRYRTTALPAATCTPSGGGSTTFPDVACSHPNWLAIHWIKVWGVTQGSPCAQGLCFNPDNNVTRAEMVTFVERLRQTGVLNTLLSTVGETDPGCAVAYPACKGWTDAEGVMDVPGWPRREANLAFQDRITSGCSGSPGNALKFCPSDFVNRAQIGEFLARTLGLVPMP
ncbi:MAG: hypothetical protein DIJKHBIC_03327 [Thermoanaerobaculia bacterium]|nr:hypothetical protein [Thermoanaerobaculia bacterium]